MECRPITPASGGVYQGVFLGERTPVSDTSLDAFESMSGTDVDIATEFMAFATGLYFPTAEAQTIAARGGSLFIKLEPWSWRGASDQSFSLESIRDGRHDAMLERFAREIAAFGRPVMLSFGHEMNGTWYPWSGNPQLYREAFQHVHDVIENIACNVTWVWNPNIDFPMQDYYPGDQYVDWVALDGYQFSNQGRRSPADLFSRDLSYLRTFRKPIMIGETATGVDDPQWISNLIDFVSDPANGISAFVYFNYDKTEGQRQSFAVSPGAEQRAYHDAIARHQLFASNIVIEGGAPIAGAQPTTPALPVTPVPEEFYRDAIPYIEDQEIGQRRVDRLSLDARQINNLVPLEQLESILRAIADVPVTTVMTDDEWETPEQFYTLRPDLGAIADLDLRYEHYFSQYLRDPRSFWENTIILLSVYVQKSLEESQPENMERALHMIEVFRQRITVQAEADTAERTSYAPASYWEAMLDMIEAEVRVQTPHQTEEFYLAGIEQTLQAIDTILSLQYRPIQPSRPDYFSIIKGIITLGDLYSQLGILSRDEKYYDVAQQLYQSVSRLQPDTTGLSIDLTPLYEDPGLTSSSQVDLSVVDSFARGHDYIIEASPMDIEEALDYNQANGFILEEDIPLTETGIYHYLRGIALVKEAGLFSALPEVKTLAEIQHYLDRLNEGEAEIREAILASGQSDERNLFFYRMAQLIEGDLRLAQADLTSLAGNYDESVAIIETANEHSFVSVEPSFRYLHIWEAVKHLEIQIRLAAYVREEEIGGRGRIRISDARSLLEFCQVNRAQIDAISEGAIVPEYFQTSLYYYMIILFIAGEPERDANGHAFYRGTGGRRQELARTTYPREAIELIERLEQRLDYMPDGIRQYYENNLALKEASAMIQINQERDTVPDSIMDRIRQRTGLTTIPADQTERRRLVLDYAIRLLRDVERRTAPVIPPYLQYNLETVLRPEIESGRPDMGRVRRVITPLSAVIRQNVEDSTVRAELLALVERINQGDRVAFDTLMRRIRELNQPAIAFIGQQTHRITWDFYSLHSDLYHSLAIAYSLDRGNPDRGHLMTQYAQSAYLASRLSTSVYDREDRPFFIFQTTAIFEDDEFGIAAAETLGRGRQNGTYLF